MFTELNPHIFLVAQCCFFLGTIAGRSFSVWSSFLTLVMVNSSMYIIAERLKKDRWIALWYQICCIIWFYWSVFLYIIGIMFLVKAVQGSKSSMGKYKKVQTIISIGNWAYIPLTGFLSGFYGFDFNSSCIVKSNMADIQIPIEAKTKKFAQKITFPPEWIWHSCW